MKCLITGGAGFIGSHLADALIEKGNEVYVIDNLSTGKESNLNKKAILIKDDIKNILKNKKVPKDLDYVFHMVAQTSVRRSLLDPIFDAETNIMGSLNLLEFCVKNKVKKIIFSSSAAVYSEDASLPVNEESDTLPKSPYGLAKLTFERYLEMISRKEDLGYVILRYSNVYGPRQDSQGEAGVITIFVNNLLKNKDLTVNGDGEQTRDFIYVKDITSANLLAMGSLSGTFNVSSEKEISINKLIEILKSKVDSPSKIIHKEAIKGELRRSMLSSRRIRSLGWKHEVALDEGLEKTLSWFRDNSL